ncbi:D-alanyl-D-alanine carboxypeptidase/D-alanyl-D-alanine-endopeptidase [Desulfotalea psychrophila]|uniref:Related to penicillin-binding protein 4 [Precursor] n=1 Tax=Desulfotalea psychrophila (strain LSv54 / DSM 12343) TaxID=177439 RepID=Q6AJD7_DESPS|nr:D-alanyl-D-alanine carboxypeptidase [Desulfotalea psychrophila]CAG37543.1 related to penicillin-binding protein 4 [Precursor] [Desulfotalea psychrophila LSv54]
MIKCCLKKTPITRRLLLVLLAWVFLPTGWVSSSSLQEDIDHGGYWFTTTSKPLRLKETTGFIPASTTKLVTALAGLRILGSDYRFSTDFLYDGKGALTIIGGGDPLLISEEIDKICRALKLRGVSRVHTLRLETSLFHLPQPALGTEQTEQPYDAHNGALVVNFNSINVRVDETGIVLSAEEQTPQLALMKDIVGLEAGKHRINVNQMVADDLPPVLRYSGELFLALLKRNGINTEDARIARGKAVEKSQLVLHWQSSCNLQETIGKCLKYSNNFIANQIFLQIGLHQYGAPATWEKGRRALNTFIQNDLRIEKSQLQLVEGSGLSRDNHISPRAMITVLENFAPYHSLLPYNSQTRTFIKTGTLRGVYCLAGFQPRGEKLYPFVIFLNQIKNSRMSVLEDLIHLSRQKKEGA